MVKCAGLRIGAAPTTRPEQFLLNKVALHHVDATNPHNYPGLHLEGWMKALMSNRGCISNLLHWQMFRVQNGDCMCACEETLVESTILPALPSPVMYHWAKLRCSHKGFLKSPGVSSLATNTFCLVCAFSERTCNRSSHRAKRCACWKCSAPIKALSFSPSLHFVCFGEATTVKNTCLTFWKKPLGNLQSTSQFKSWLCYVKLLWKTLSLWLRSVQRSSY